MPKTDVTVKLLGEDGNAFNIMGRVAKAMRSAGVDPKIIEAYRAEAMSGDYNNLLRVTTKYVEVE